MTTFSDPVFAAEMRDTIEMIVRAEVARLRPADAYAIVQTVDAINDKATVTYPGEESAVPVSMGTFQPTSGGDVVRICGLPGDRYIQDIVSGALLLDATELNLDRSGATPGRVTIEGPVGDESWVIEPVTDDLTFTSTPGAKAWQLEGDTGVTRLPGSLFVNGVDVTKMPLGRVASSTMTANSAAFTTTVYPLSLTTTVLPARKLRVRVHTNVQSATANAGIAIGIANNVGTILTQAYRAASTANAAEQISCELEVANSGAGGSITYQMSAFGSASSLIIASGSAVTYLTVYDEGAV